MAVLLTAPAASRAEGPAGTKALVERCVAAYGGSTALKSAARVREKGTVTSLLHPGEKAPILRLYDRVRGLFVEVDWKSGAERRIMTEGRGFREGEEVEGPPLMAMQLQAARLDLPALLLVAQEHLTDRGTVTLQGKTLRALVVNLGHGLTVEADLDPATGRILRSRSAADDTPGVDFTTSYSDFRRVEGHLVAFREQNYANGAVTGETVLTEVAFPKALPDSVFIPSARPRPDEGISL
jgi:hypothetical protein